MIMTVMSIAIIHLPSVSLFFSGWQGACQQHESHDWSGPLWLAELIEAQVPVSYCRTSCWRLEDWCHRWIIVIIFWTLFLGNIKTIIKAYISCFIIHNTKSELSVTFCTVIKIFWSVSWLKIFHIHAPKSDRGKSGFFMKIYRR